MLSFIKGLFGSKKPTSTVESQPHPLDIAKYTPPATAPAPTPEQVDKALAVKEWPSQPSTPLAAPEPAPSATSEPTPEPAPVAEKKPRKPRAKKEVVAAPVKTAIPVAAPKTKPRAKK